MQSFVLRLKKNTLIKIYILFTYYTDNMTNTANHWALKFYLLLHRDKIKSDDVRQFKNAFLYFLGKI